MTDLVWLAAALVGAWVFGAARGAGPTVSRAVAAIVAITPAIIVVVRGRAGVPARGKVRQGRAGRAGRR